MNVNIPQLADSLFERTTNTSWVVVFKSLITTHHLMVYGNEVSPVGRYFHFVSFHRDCDGVVFNLVTLPLAFCPVLGLQEYTIQPQ